MAVGTCVVLVVEDEPILRMMAVSLVEDAGYEAVEAACADDAVEILERRPDIRILFADIDMPGSMDGLALALAVRDRWPPVEIILTSGKNNPKSLPARGLFFQKPYDAGEVSAALQRMAAG